MILSRVLSSVESHFTASFCYLVLKLYKGLTKTVSQLIFKLQLNPLHSPKTAGLKVTVEMWLDFSFGSVLSNSMFAFASILPYRVTQFVQKACYSWMKNTNLLFCAIPSQLMSVFCTCSLESSVTNFFFFCTVHFLYVLTKPYNVEIECSFIKSGLLFLDFFFNCAVVNFFFPFSQ